MNTDSQSSQDVQQKRHMCNANYITLLEGCLGTLANQVNETKKQIFIKYIFQNPKLHSVPNTEDIFTDTVHTEY
jgi:hypothetical protein